MAGYNKCIDKISYQTHPTQYNIIGFITNIHDAVSYDICLQWTPEQEKLYSDVLIEDFSYIDFTDLTIPENFNDISTHSVDHTYRCRLKGVGVNENARAESSHRMIYGRNSTHAAIDVSRIIDRSDGWVICNISDVDIYRRLLVEIVVYIPSTSEIINLRNYLLTHSTNYGNMFHAYGSNKPLYPSNKPLYPAHSRNYVHQKRYLAL